MLQPEQLQDMALTARALGALLYWPPDSEQAAPLVTLLRQPQETQRWPYGSSAQREHCAALLCAPAQESLASAYQRLFIGPHALAAPPWGSVYLDRESVLFGESTLALRHWMHAQGISWQSDAREPEDHIGILLLLTAWLAEGQPQQLPALLQQHLLPWGGRYLTLLQQGADHPFYQGLASLAALTLQAWQRQFAIVDGDVRLYR
ncbi:Tat proofreading chaperone DmsD [Edwardsiella piscicida]|uniref:Tat proofreading chaperone DmsD n=3 Tax=Edwardsiella TaxID=635 RepID=A0A0H3DVX3_EDWTF|nr:Tat proofreading chaperone DmsD [Edwardsiella piscicida]ACY85026.1 putative twin-argninine leader-binding DmsD [Edwardsiella tarda EIB202]ADM42089.1 Putative oxidoreductase component [Edwardsiella tarda FL6-60]AGH74202.1 Putative oxidoreductase component [Edwardsiella piscicida C07-087]AOP43421.1 Tat proofreading chaperone DmsD [Edwardsiella piscicida]ARD19532.1 DMSO reductase maturation protein DsmD [Edwardsiella piscicida]